MRKIIVLTFVSLDGVMQGPGGQPKIPRAVSTHGGWTVPYFDEFLGQVMTEQMSKPFDLLLGRKTFEISPPTGPTTGRRRRHQRCPSSMWPRIRSPVMSASDRHFSKATSQTKSLS